MFKAGIAALALVATGFLASSVNMVNQILPKVTITGDLPNYNSDKIYFAPVQGAVDYRVYNITHIHNTEHGEKNVYKYSGGNTSVDINDLDITAKEQPLYVVEALDSYGPYQYSDGSTPHNEMYSINGRVLNGDEPTAIARSEPFHPQCGPQYNQATPGSQVLFEEFWANSSPFQFVSIPVLTKQEKTFTAFFGDKNTHQRLENDKWTVDFTGHAFGQTQVFVHPGAAHMMDWLEDGGSKSGNLPAHVNQASTVFSPKNVICDLSTGKTAHLSFEVDAFFTDRRWVDVWVLPAGQEFINPGEPKTDKRPVNKVGKGVRWKILNNINEVRVWNNNLPVTEKLNGVGKKPFSYRREEVGLNGTEKDLDNKHRFDIYYSKNHIKLTETKDGLEYIICDQDFVNNPNMDKIEFKIVHRLYHTNLDNRSIYFSQVSPHRDLRHWGPVRIELL